jgi:hypothetical protein
MARYEHLPIYKTAMDLTVVVRHLTFGQALMSMWELTR